MLLKLLPFDKILSYFKNIPFALQAYRSKKKTKRDYVKLLGDGLFYCLLGAYCALYIWTPNSSEYDACSNEYFDMQAVNFSCEDVTVRLVSNEWAYRFLAFDFNGSSYGMNGFFNHIFIDLPAVEASGQEVDALVKHELEHTRQKEYLGPIKFLLSPKWLLEGSADYVRGKPTIEYCSGLSDWGQEPDIKQFYFESWAKVFYLVDVKKVPYDDLFSVAGDYQFDEQVITSSLTKIFCSQDQ